MGRTILGAMAVGAMWVAASAQERPRTFDAVSIRESVPSATTAGAMRLVPNGDIRVEHMPVSTIIAVAHRLDSYRVVDAPDWIASTYYDILAKANAATTRDDTLAMMRAMLAERFKLAAHHETRPLPGFAMVRASRLGPRLQPSKVNCEENPRGPRCSESAITSNSLRVFGSPIANVITIVAGVVRAPILDKTNLVGTFDVDLQWSRDASPTDDTPVMPTALQEQLGLRLQREQVPTDVLVIDHVERPSEN
jgi:uncharacterized protein (TIGR03435 family)